MTSWLPENIFLCNVRFGLVSHAILRQNSKLNHAAI